MTSQRNHKQHSEKNKWTLTDTLAETLNWHPKETLNATLNETLNWHPKETLNENLNETLKKP